MPGSADSGDEAVNKLLFSRSFRSTPSGGVSGEMDCEQIEKGYRVTSAMKTIKQDKEIGCRPV